MKYVNVQPNMSWQIIFISINRILCILLKDLNIKTWDEKYSYRLKKQLAKHKYGLCIFKKKLNENRVSYLVIIRKNAYFLLKQCILLRRTSFIGWSDFNEWVKSFFFISIENSRNSEPIFLLTCNNFCKSIIKTHKRVNAFVQIHYHKKKFD